MLPAGRTPVKRNPLPLIKSWASSFGLPRRGCSTAVVPKVAVVGAGPAGFYATQHLVKAVPGIQVDIYEKLPVPYGLVRFGVAPDHPEVKNCISTFNKTVSNPAVTYYGNMCLGKDINLEDLRANYNSVLLTYGADENRTLGIPGEDLENVMAAKDVVSLYNGVPGYQDLKVNLDTDTVLVIGIGNVALDVVRMLLTPVDQLRKTDTTDAWLEQLVKSRVEKVVVAGRRGPLQVSFTIKELRELLKLDGVRTMVRKEDLVGVREALATVGRPRKRLTELLLKAGEQQTMKKEAGKEWQLKLFRSPLQFLSDDGQSSKVSSAVLGVNRAVGDQVEDTGEKEIINTGLVLRSIGYKSVSVDASLPFDTGRGIVPNVEGRVIGEEGLYVAGWLATGPRGVIIDTMNTAFRVASLMAEDLKSKALPEVEGREGLQLHQSKNVSWEDWEKIDTEESKRGEAVGKPREKIWTVEEMLKAAHS